MLWTRKKDTLLPLEVEITLANEHSAGSRKFKKWRLSIFFFFLNRRGGVKKKKYTNKQPANRKGIRWHGDVLEVSRSGKTDKVKLTLRSLTPFMHF